MMECFIERREIQDIAREGGYFWSLKFLHPARDPHFLGSLWSSAFIGFLLLLNFILVALPEIPSCQVYAI
jgi:hypothetical protein